MHGLRKTWLESEEAGSVVGNANAECMSNAPAVENSARAPSVSPRDASSLPPIDDAFLNASHSGPVSLPTSLPTLFRGENGGNGLEMENEGNMGWIEDQETTMSVPALVQTVRLLQSLMEMFRRNVQGSVDAVDNRSDSRADVSTGTR